MARPISALVRPSGLIAVLLALALVSFAAAAQRLEGTRAQARGVYSAEIEVNGQGERERQTGISRALEQVLAKLSGDRQTARRPGVAEALRQAENYVEGFDYRQDEGVSPSGAPTFNTILVVRFDQEKVDGLASALGIPIWPSPRPKPVLWLAIDDGSGPRLVGLAQSGAARAALDRATERGYRLGLPNGTAAEQALVGAIWRGDAAAVARASQRYSPPMQLIGKLYRSNGGWASDWIFVDHGRVLSRWSESGPSARALMAVGADGAADALMKRYAKAAPTGPAGTYRIAIDGIDDTADYVRLSAYLQRLPVVQGIVPVQADGSGMQIDLQLVSGLVGFDHVVSAGDVLIGGGVQGAVATADAPVTNTLPPLVAPGAPQATYRMR